MALLRLYDLGELPGLVPEAPPEGGMVWARGGRFARLGLGGVAWERRLELRPVWSVAGPWLYAAAGDLLQAALADTGEVRWGLHLPGQVRAVAGDAAGVDVLFGAGRDAAWVRVEAGRPGEPVPVPEDVSQVCRVRGTAWLGGVSGMYRPGPDGRLVRVLAGACRAILAREAGVQALVEAAPGRGGLMEDDGMPLVWGFLSPDTHVLLPWGAGDWLVCDRATGRDVRVVGRRLDTRWSWAGPAVRDVTVAGPCVALDVVAPEPTLAVQHPEGGPALELHPAGIDALHGDGPFLLVTHGETSHLYLFEEASRC